MFALLCVCVVTTAVQRFVLVVVSVSMCFCVRSLMYSPRPLFPVWVNACFTCTLAHLCLVCPFSQQYLPVSLLYAGSSQCITPVSLQAFVSLCFSLLSCFWPLPILSWMILVSSGDSGSDCCDSLVLTISCMYWCIFVFCCDHLVLDLAFCDFFRNFAT